MVQDCSIVAQERQARERERLTVAKIVKQGPRLPIIVLSWSCLSRAFVSAKRVGKQGFLRCEGNDGGTGSLADL
jgi:hypothetical protein